MKLEELEEIIEMQFESSRAELLCEEQEEHDDDLHRFAREQYAKLNTIPEPQRGKYIFSALSFSAWCDMLDTPCDGMPHNSVLRMLHKKHDLKKDILEQIIYDMQDFPCEERDNSEELDNGTLSIVAEGLEDGLDLYFFITRNLNSFNRWYEMSFLEPLNANDKVIDQCTLPGASNVLRRLYLKIVEDNACSALFCYSSLFGVFQEVARLLFNPNEIPIFEHKLNTTRAQINDIEDPKTECIEAIFQHSELTSQIVFACLYFVSLFNYKIDGKTTWLKQLCHESTLNFLRDYAYLEYIEANQLNLTIFKGLGITLPADYTFLDSIQAVEEWKNQEIEESDSIPESQGIEFNEVEQPVQVSETFKKVKVAGRPKKTWLKKGSSINDTDLARVVCGIVWPKVEEEVKAWNIVKGEVYKKKEQTINGLCAAIIYYAAQSAFYVDEGDSVPPSYAETLGLGGKNVSRPTINNYMKNVMKKFDRFMSHELYEGDLEDNSKYDRVLLQDIEGLRKAIKIARMTLEKHIG